MAFKNILYILVVLFLVNSVHGAWVNDDGIIYSEDSTINAQYYIGSCPTNEFEINDLPRKYQAIFRFNKFQNSHVGNNSATEYDKVLCLTDFGFKSFEMNPEGDIKKNIALYLAQDFNSHFKENDGIELLESSFSGNESLEYNIITRIQEAAPDKEFTCVGSLAGSEDEGYHFGNCDYNPLNKVWLAIKKGVLVRIEAPFGVNGVNNVYLNISCQDDKYGCNPSLSKFYYSPERILRCPEDKSLYTIDNGNFFQNSGYVCAKGENNNGVVGFSSPVQIEVFNLEILTDIPDLIETSSLSTDLSIETSTDAYCAFELRNSGIETPFQSDISTYATRNYQKDHFTMIQLNEGDFNTDVNVTLRCYQKKYLNSVEDSFTIRLGEIIININSSDDFQIYSSEKKNFDLNITNSYGNPIYGLSPINLDTYIIEDNTRIEGLTGVISNGEEYSLYFDAKVDPGNYKIGVDCKGSLTCNNTFLEDIEVLKPSLTIGTGSTSSDSGSNFVQYEDSETKVIFVADEISYVTDGSKDTIQIEGSIKAYIVNKDTFADDVISKAFDSESRKAYLVLKEEDIGWVEKELEGMSKKILLKNVGTDEKGRKIVEIELIE